LAAHRSGRLGEVDTTGGIGGATRGIERGCHPCLRCGGGALDLLEAGDELDEIAFRAREVKVTESVANVTDIERDKGAVARWTLHDALDHVIDSSANQIVLQRCS